MLKICFYGFAIGLIVYHASPLAAQTDEECADFCYSAGRACMQACTDIFKDEKRCEDVCQFADKTCTTHCVEEVCKKECQKTSANSIETEKCIEKCHEKANPMLKKFLNL